jgi:hypothetical protein
LKPTRCALATSTFDLFVFEIFADGRKIGITVAHDEPAALISAHSATTRHTESKMDVSCDFEGLIARPLGPVSTPIGERLKNTNENGL